MSNMTLTQRLFLRIAPTILVTIICIGFLAFQSSTRKINSVYDAQLINNASILWMMEEDEFTEGPQNISPKEIDSQNSFIKKQFSQNEDADDYADARMMRIWKGNKIVLYSNTAFPASVPKQHEGFSDVLYKNEKWRVYNLAAPSFGVNIEVGEKISLRKDIVQDILFYLFIPLFFLIPIIGIMVWVGIGNGLVTVRRLVEQIRHRSSSNLSPLKVDTLPPDLKPLEVSVNQLLLQLEQSLVSERRFSDHAAHELRTPLAGFSLQLQMLASLAQDKESQSIIQGLMASNDRATKMVGQLLTIARLNHEALKITSIPLYKVTASVIAELSSLINQKHMDISLSGVEDVSIAADETLLRLAISNLVDNALKYTPAYGQINVHIGLQGDMWRLSIEDTGPGIPQEHRDLVFNRFYRIDSPKEEGSGLGLAIVAEAIQRLSGKISLNSTNTGHGLLVEVFFPYT
jgi:two-component system sensor histidine kinase QseC